jgi:hypothetical protein
MIDISFRNLIKSLNRYRIFMYLIKSRDRDRDFFFRREKYGRGYLKWAVVLCIRVNMIFNIRMNLLLLYRRFK